MDPQVLFRGTITGASASAQDIGVFTLPAGYLADGEVATVRIDGKNSNAAGEDHGLTIGFKIGATTKTIASAEKIVDGNSNEKTILEYTLQRVGADLILSGKKASGDLGAAGDDYQTFTGVGTTLATSQVSITIQGTFGDTPEATVTFSVDNISIRK